MNANTAYGRPRDEREFTAWAGIVHRSFGLPLAEMPAWIAQLGEDNARVLRGTTAPLGALALLDMGQWFGGKSVSTGGVVAVGVEPFARGGGHGAQLMNAMLGELAQKRCALSTLFPATNTFYRACGYELAGARYDVTLRLRELALDGDVDLAGVWMRPMTAEDVPAIRRVYAARARLESGWLDRHRYIWARVQNWLGEERQGYVIGHADEIEGYVFAVQRRTPGVGEQELGIGDVITLTRRAAARVVTFCRGYSTLCPRARLNLAPDDLLFAVLAENSYEARLQMPWMLRIVDVERALASRGYAAALRGALELELADDLLAANRGRWTLTVEGGSGTVTSGGRAALQLDVRALASLYSGWRSASSLARLGMCRGDDATLALADALFAGPAPSMPDMF
jgi:predicted acetyltransferase